MKINAASMCLKGRRERIEDFHYLNTDSGIFIVADGVAGAPNGDLASRFITNHIAKFLEDRLSDDISSDEIKKRLYISALQTEKKFRRYIKRNSHILERGFSHPQTTLTAAVLRGTDLVYLSVGDSALFILYEEESAIKIKRITKSFPFFVGGVYDFETFSVLYNPVSNVHNLSNADFGFILCTDGIYNHLIDRARRAGKINPAFDLFSISKPINYYDKIFEKEIKRILCRKNRMRYNHPSRIIDALRDECSDAKDNVTVIYCNFKE